MGTETSMRKDGFIGSDSRMGWGGHNVVASHATKNRRDLWRFGDVGWIEGGGSADRVALEGVVGWGGVAGALALLTLRLELKAARRRSEKRREEEIAGLW